MFIGHYGIGLAAKKTAKTISLGTFFLASQWIDLIWPILVLLNIEQVIIQPGDTKLTPLEFTHYPYSHSLIFVLMWGIVLGGIYFLLKKNKRNALIIGLLVVSHWILDLIVHKPDLPLVPGGPYLGLGLWNIPVIAVILESIIYISGIILYVNTTTPKDKIGIYGFWSLIIILALIHAINLTGPPPPDIDAIGWAGLLLWLFVLWAYWADKHRTIKSE